MDESGTAESNAIGENVKARHRLPCRYSISIDKLFISFFLYSLTQHI